MSLPNFRLYYHTAQLKTITIWCNSEYRVNWKDMARGYNGVLVQGMIGDHIMTIAQDHLSPLALIKLILVIWLEFIPNATYELKYWTI